MEPALFPIWRRQCRVCHARVRLYSREIEQIHTHRIYLFAVMMWLSAVGYTMFPLTDSGFAGTFQDVMHVVVTVLVVVLSITSLLTITIGSFRSNHYRSLEIWAAAALLLMVTGAIGINVVPIQYFGIPERFSVIAAMGFNAVLGVYLFRGFGGE